MSFESPLPPFNSSDPAATFLSSSCLDLLMIELVPMAYRIVNDVDARQQADWDAGRSTAQSPVSGRKEGAVSASAAAAGGGGSVSGSGSVGGRSGNAKATGTGTGRRMDEEEERDAVFWRLEGLGYRVGQGLVERFSRDRPRFTDTLDCIKFLCKDLWMLVFRKQIDNLKTNHRGVYVLTDNSFRPLARMSTEAGGGAVVRAAPFLYFPCGIIRGALASMGINASVQAETNELPGAIFQIKSIPNKPS